VGRPVGETEASSHPAKKWVTGLIGSLLVSSQYAKDMLHLSDAKRLNNPLASCAEP
jgi:hypothetical protein